MNNQMQFRFSQPASRTLLQALLLSAKTMTVFPLALRQAPQNTKNIIRTREKKDHKDFSTNTHRGTHSFTGGKKGQRYVYFAFSLVFLDAAAPVSQDTLSRSAAAQCQRRFSIN